MKKIARHLLSVRDIIRRQLEVAHGIATKGASRASFHSQAMANTGGDVHRPWKNVAGSVIGLAAAEQVDRQPLRCCRSSPKCASGASFHVVVQRLREITDCTGREAGIPSPIFPRGLSADQSASLSLPDLHGHLIECEEVSEQSDRGRPMLRCTWCIVEMWQFFWSS